MTSTSSTEGMSSAGPDSVFERVEMSGNVKAPRVDESSLAVIDLDLVDTSFNLVENPSTLSSGWLRLDGHSYDHAKTPDAKFSVESLVNKKTCNRLPSSSSLGSPILPANVAASTPVQSKPVPSRSDLGGAGDGVEALCTGTDRQEENGGYTLENGDIRNKFIPIHKPGESESKTDDHEVRRNATFILRGPAIVNEDLSDQLQEQCQETSSFSAKSSSFEASRDTSATSSKSGSKRETKKGARKPLSTQNKAPNSLQLHKRANCNPAPRMNAAALSRIQAKFPKKQPLKTRDENATCLVPSSGISSSAGRPLATKQTVVAKKPLPSRPQTANATKQLISKRKIEAPKKAGRPSKVDVIAKPNSATSSLLRNTAHTTSRLGNPVSARTNSNLRKPQVTSIPHPRAAAPITSDTHASTKLSLRKSAIQNKPKAESNVQRNRRIVQVKEYKTSQCVVALATLLDHVVNRLGGLSAPKLSSEKEQLERLVTDQRTSNDKLTSHNDDLEESLRESRATHERDVDHHEAEMTQLKAILEATKRDLRQQIEDITKQLLQQTTDHQLSIDSMKEENRVTIEDLTSKYEEELTQLRQEWSDEREEMETETLELRNSINARVEEKVEELIQPYINSYEENKSLRLVLELKNEKQHKLTSELESHKEQLKEVHSLRDHVIRLEQRNEDLQTQVEEKNSEQRELRSDLADRSRELSDQQRINSSQLQKLDELHYRLNTSTPSPAFQFNPVFTPSSITSTPTTSQGGSFNASGSEPCTPFHVKHRRSGFRDADSAETTQENGTS